MEPDHDWATHVIEGSPHEQTRRILARHLCGWITGHHAPIDHMLADADMILAELHAAGIRFHMRAETANDADGLIAWSIQR